MKEMLEKLSEKERAQLKLLGLLSLVALFVLLFFSLGQRRSYYLLVDQQQARQNAAATAEEKRAQSVAGWERWEQTLKDIETLKQGFFYHEDQAVNELRTDMEKIFLQSGINSRSFRYSYANLEQGRIGRITVTFNFTGTYPILKRFVQTVERYPKFLFLEKIDFQKISGGGTVLELRIVLAGYYAQP